MEKAKFTEKIKKVEKIIGSKERGRPNKRQIDSIKEATGLNLQNRPANQFLGLPLIAQWQVTTTTAS